MIVSYLQNLKSRHFWTAVALLTLVSGCQRGMYDQPRYDPLEESTFSGFENGSSARMPVEGTIARGNLRLDKHLYEGRIGDQFADEFPAEVTAEILDRGQERFRIYCSHCHGYDGMGNGMVVRRGFKKPPSFHEQRLVDLPVGHYFDVMSRGFGQMPSLAAQVSVSDRWAIAAYMRALQKTRNFDLESLSEEQRNLIETQRAELEAKQLEEAQ